ncbi:hypothetical protein GJAV_G00092690 [Gymnothorax javanicus]|nr:hypothetical protein GJAV_G00092690 [Gymnothorax javanicus]
MRTTLICLWLLYSLVHMISGCSLYAPKHVTGYTGGSVVLPCYCIYGWTVRRKSDRWISYAVSPEIHIWTNPDKVDYRYRDRVAISKEGGNFTLHLSHLTQRDDGEYRCEIQTVFFLKLDPKPSLGSEEVQSSCPVSVLMNRANLSRSSGLQIQYY